MGLPRPGVPVPVPTYGAQRPPPAFPSVQPPVVQPAAQPKPPAASSGPGLVGRVISDRYAVRAVIGEGGMGVVYQAEHLAMGREVAVKVLHPSKAQNREAVSRLRHEARVAGTLGHPNICAVYDLGRLDDGSPYLVMERLHGETLAQRLARKQRLPAAEMVDVMLQVLSALAAAHQRAVIHRDLKPDNIFLAQREGIRPTPKLLDFGISKSEDMEETVADPTGQRFAAGTPYYMAPEQARGDRDLDFRVDLWAAGVVLYEGLTGQRPFQAKNYNALLVQILSMAHRPMRELDPDMIPALCRIIDRALAKRPDDRFQSAVEFQNALRAYKDEDQAPRIPMPILLSEQTFDDSDETTVFQRVKLEQVINQTSVEEDATPIYAPPGDDDRTVVDTPSFLVERTVVMPNPKPGRKA